MLSEKIFQEALAMFSINFGFEIKGDDGKIYKRMVYDALKSEVTDQDFKERAKNIMKQTTNKDWNEAYGYGGKPTIADWISAFVPPEKWIEQEQTYKCSVTGANLVRRVMVKVGNQLKITKE